MSSATSTKDLVPRDGGTAPKDHALQPWQFFVLAALGCATAATFMARGQGVTVVVLLALLMAGAALVGLMTLRTLQPLVTSEEDRTVMVGRRTRAALEREKFLTLRAIKELEFDRAMGKLSEEDFTEMGGRLRLRAARLIRQLDAGGGYRAQIERDLEKKVGEVAAPPKPAVDARVCPSCETRNDADARFCKDCGQPLAGAESRA